MGARISTSLPSTPSLLRECVRGCVRVCGVYVCMCVRVCVCGIVRTRVRDHTKERSVVLPTTAMASADVLEPADCTRRAPLSTAE